MPNQNTKAIPHQYHAGDMQDVNALAAEGLSWAAMGLHDLNLHIKKIKAELDKIGVETEYRFMQLDEILGMHQYLAEHRANCHKEQAEHYREEWERVKGGEHDNTP